eukprot:SAG31_NODE_478_length_15144_cov_15.165769_10_plen_188_part_00
MLIPPEDKPGKMPIDRCAELKRLLGHANSFISKRDNGHAITVQGSRNIPATVAAMSLDELRDEVVRLSTEGMSGAAASSSEQDLESERAAMEEQVLTELASHPTVTYVRALEEEREGYRDALQVETKRTRDQRVALEAKDRIIAKLRDQLQSVGSSGRKSAMGAMNGNGTRGSFPAMGDSRPISAAH